MKIVYNKILPFGKRFYAINLFGVLFSKGPCDKVIINHEMIHTAQMKEMLYVFFYIAYLGEWLYRLVKTRNYFEAYCQLTFEREAYNNQNNAEYLKTRKPFAEFR